MAIRLPSPMTALAGGALIAVLTALLSSPLRAEHHGAEGAHASHAEPQASKSPVVLYESGVHYEELLIPVATSDPEKIEVVEMFSYLCIHCFNFDAAVSEWASRVDDDVVFTRVPAIFSKPWQLYAQAFYTAEALGVSAETHDVLFEAVHNSKKDSPPPQSPEALAALFNRVAGVQEASFMKAFNSFSVRSKVQQANSRARQVRLQSVPTLVVNGKYKTNSSLAGTNLGMLQVVDFLVEKERAALAASAEATQTEAEAVTSE